MNCPECTRLHQLFREAQARHLALHNKDLAAIQAGDKITMLALDRELELSLESMKAISDQMFTHADKHPGMRRNGGG